MLDVAVRSSADPDACTLDWPIPRASELNLDVGGPPLAWILLPFLVVGGERRRLTARARLGASLASGFHFRRRQPPVSLKRDNLQRFATVRGTFATVLARWRMGRQRGRGWRGHGAYAVTLAGVILALSGAGWAANSSGEASSHEGDSVPRQSAQLHGARWMALEPRSGGLLVLAGGESGDGGLRLMLVRADGRLKRTYELPTANPDTEAHLFPNSGKVAITTPVSLKAPAESLRQPGTRRPSGHRVWLLDLGSGKVQPLATAATAFSTDPSRDRLYVARGRNFRVIDVARGSNVATRVLATSIEGVTIDAAGRVHLLHVPTASAETGVERLAVLTPPEYLADGFLAEDVLANGQPPVLLAMAHTEVPVGVAPRNPDDEADDDSDEAMDTDDEDGSETAAPEQNPRVFGPAPGADSILVHEEASGKLSIYDATTHALINEQRDFYGQIVAFDANGRALVVSGKHLERRDARSFELLQSVDAGGFINVATFDSKSNCVFAIVESFKGGHWQDELVRLELNRLAPVL